MDLTIGYGPRKNTALHAATIIRNVKIVEVLLKNGANIHVKNAEGETAIMRAAKDGNAQMVLEKFSEKFKILN